MSPWDALGWVLVGVVSSWLALSVVAVVIAAVRVARGDSR